MKFGRREILTLLTGALAGPAASRLAHAEEAGIVLPQLFGAAADGRTDDTEAINRADQWCAQNRRTLHFQGEYFAAGQLLHSDNVAWVGLGATIWSGRTSLDSDKSISAAVRSRRCHSLADFYRAFRASPHGLRPTEVASGCALMGDLAFRWAPQALEFARRHGAATRMCMAYYMCHDFQIGDGVRFDCGYGDWTVTHWGDRFRGGRFRIEGGEERPIYSDGFHSLGGDGGLIIGAEVSSGDDCFALANHYGQASRGWRFVDCTGFSRLATAFKLSVGRLGVTASYPHAPAGQIEDIRIEGARWAPLGPSRNSFFRVDTGRGVGGSRIEDRTLVRNVDFDGIMDGRNEGLPEPLFRGEVVAGGMPAISNVGGTDIRIRARIRHASLWVAFNEGGDRISYDLDSPDPPNWTGASGGICAVECRPLYNTGGESGNSRSISYRATSPRINGLIRGGDRGPIRLVEVDEAFSDRLRLHGIGNGQQAIDMSLCSGPNSFTVSDYLEIVGAPGATAPFGFKLARQSRVAVRNLYAENVHLARADPKPALLQIGRRLAARRS